MCHPEGRASRPCSRIGLCDHRFVLEVDAAPPLLLATRLRNVKHHPSDVGHLPTLARKAQSSKHTIRPAVPRSRSVTFIEQHPQVQASNHR
ncbi:AAEL014374-PA [Aedes aegypti]|uniref:AAEL014374-PA n=1 Tax=Aedes aegypti TaxID=7159 RepID=Q16GH8_AEDAE|nr:AAEL014374-PA [Aedes aegypti]